MALLYDAGAYLPEAKQGQDDGFVQHGVKNLFQRE
jgi:hypothetical protein